MHRLTDADWGKLIREQVENPPPGESQLHCFMRHLWRFVDPHPFLSGWHIQAKCEVLTHVHNGEIKNLVLNEPPGSCKSMLCNVFWPAFIWLQVRKETRMAFGSFDQRLVDRDAGKFINLLRHPVVRAAWPEFNLGGENEKKAVQGFENTHGGLRFGTTPGSTGTGWHFDGHVYDDLIKPMSILDGVSGDAQKSLSAAIRWIRQTMANRAIDLEKLWRVIISQRLHELDPSGHLLKDGTWEHLCFPEEYQPKAKWIIGDLSKKYDKRTEPGELLWKERRNEKAVAKIKADMKDAGGYDAQYLQNPATQADGILKKKDFLKHGYHNLPHLDHCSILASWDLNFGSKNNKNMPKEGKSRVACTLWAEHQGIYYLIDGEAEHLDYAGAKTWVRNKLEDPLWSRAEVYLIEAKANGPALVSDLQEETMKLEEFEPGSTSKAERMLPFIIPVRQGKVRAPHPDTFPQHEHIIDEITKFPNGEYDDFFDTMSQALAYYVSGGALNYSKALRGYYEMNG